MIRPETIKAEIKTMKIYQEVIMNKIEVVSDKISLLGECPLWDSKKELLYWIDIINGEISSINLKNNILSTITTDLFIGCIALRENGELILGSDRGLFYL